MNNPRKTSNKKLQQKYIDIIINWSTNGLNKPTDIPLNNQIRYYISRDKKLGSKTIGFPYQSVEY